MFGKNRDKGGFSLLEVIFALGLMAVSGVLILQLFMAGAQLSTAAGDIDTASFIVMSVIEDINGSDNPNRLLGTEFVEGAQVAFGLSAFFVMEERMEFSAFDFSNGFRLYKYYDANWQPLRLELAEEEPEAPQNINAAFKLGLSLVPQGHGEEMNDAGIAGLFDLTVRVLSLGRSDGYTIPIADFYTKVYFPPVTRIAAY